jgi:hypothetical protein
MLHFLFGLLIVGTIIVMMVAYPAFRYFSFLLVIAGGIGIWALIENNSKQAREADQRRVAEQQFAATAIKTGDVQLDDVKLTKTNYGTSEFVLSARLQTIRSTHAATGL